MHRTYRFHPLGIFGFFKPRFLIAFLQWNRQKTAVGLERPGMIRTTEKLASIALTINGDFRALVRTAIVQHLDLTIGMAHLYHWLITNLSRIVIALFRGLAFVANKHPGIGKQVPHFQVIDRMAGIDIPMHLIALNHGFNIFCHQWLRFLRHCSHSYKSSTSRDVFARLTHICMTFPEARSASDKTTSR